MKAIKTIKALRQEIRGVKSGVAGDTVFSAKAIFFIAEQQVEIVELLKELTRIPPKVRAKSKVRAKRWYEFW